MHAGSWTVCISGTGTTDDGSWLVIPCNPQTDGFNLHLPSPPCGPFRGAPFQVTPMVSTGLVDWHGDACAEIYVPQHRLASYLAEHDLASP